MSTNYYQTLGVDRQATSEEIKRAYRRLASQHHPDKGGDKHRFQEIQKAYETLGDEQRRAHYDNLHAFGGVNVNMSGPGGFDFDTIFNMFGANFNSHQHNQRMRQVARMTLWVTLNDIAQGGRRTVAVGTQQGTQAIEIEIPLGINDGDTVQYPEIIPKVDLQITYRIHPNPAWTRNGLNLTQDYNASIWDLILGTEITVSDILGNNFTVNIPAGTQPNAVFRLKGQGLRPRSGSAGDMLVRIQARIPTVIDPELREMIKQKRPK